ncbi:AAA family ATPase [Litorimonas haliclonae]|uniref:AAA family ATPase n=1 Tax=Litorimonas haliclonae TaxID=2081977 RepID=UPI0039EFE52B
MTDFLAQYGKPLLDKGYPIIPIKLGLKHPGRKGWQDIKADKDNLSAWLSNGYAHGGVGILTATTPAVDLDILDRDICDRMTSYVERLGYAPRRTGRAPKTLFVFRTDVPFAKMKSRTFEDMFGDRHAVEILGKGQQFVSHATHPDTGSPYRWHGDDLADVPYSDLTVLSRDDAKDIITYFESIIPDDWEEVEREQGALPAELPDGVSDDLRALAYAKPPLDLTTDQIKTCLSVLSERCDSYEDWVKTGMALYHQFGGGQQGFALWNDWSMNSLKYRGEEMAAKWRTFSANLSNTRPVTFATVLAWAKEEKRNQTSIADDSSLFMHISELAEQLGPTKWQVEGFLEQDATGVLFGPPGAYKSFLALDWALCTASGKDWHGHEVEQGTAIYIAGEGHNGLAKRVVAWGQHHNVDISKLPFYLTKRPIRLRDGECAAELRNHIEKITEGGPSAKLVVIDTVARNFGSGDENSTADMSDFVSRVDSDIRVPLGATVMPIHHTGHSNKDRMRGSNALEGAADFLFRLGTEEGTSKAVLTNTRQKNSELADPFWLEPQTIMIGGFDTEITSLVLNETSPPVPVEEETPLKGKQLALFKLVETEAPVEREALRNIAIEDGIFETTAQFRRAVNELKKKEKISENDNKFNILEAF